MAKKMVKRKKLRIFRLLLVLLILGVFILLIELYLNTKIKNIIIKNNQILTDDEIIEMAGITDYPSFYFTTSYKLKKKLNKNKYIKEVKIKKQFYHKIVIEVVENKPLFINVSENKVVLENKKEIKLDKRILRIPRLMNYVPNTKYDTLIKDMKKIDEDILGKISEMTYVPNDYDKDRFVLYMDDGNTVYITLTKFKMINYYNDVLKQLSGRKGILYLDSGNHFQIME